MIGQVADHEWQHRFLDPPSPNRPPFHCVVTQHVLYIEVHRYDLCILRFTGMTSQPLCSYQGNLVQLCPLCGLWPRTFPLCGYRSLLCRSLHFSPLHASCTSSHSWQHRKEENAEEEEEKKRKGKERFSSLLCCLGGGSLPYDCFVLIYPV